MVRIAYQCFEQFGLLSVQRRFELRPHAIAWVHVCTCTWRPNTRSGSARGHAFTCDAARVAPARPCAQETQANVSGTRCVSKNAFYAACEVCVDTWAQCGGQVVPIP